jgi:hypothetical protein
MHGMAFVCLRSQARIEKYRKQRAKGNEEGRRLLASQLSLACPPKAGPVLMGIVQLAESQGATHAKTTRS